MLASRRCRLAVAAQGGAVVAEAVQFHVAGDPSAEVAVVAGQFAGARGQVGVDEICLQVVARLRAERRPAVAVDRAAEDLGGHGPQRRLRLAPRQELVVALRHARAEHRLLVVDPERPQDLRELVVAAGQGIERQLAAHLEAGPVRPAGNADVAVDVLQPHAAIDAHLVQTHVQVPLRGHRLGRIRRRGPAGWLPCRLMGPVAFSSPSPFLSCGGRACMNSPVHPQAIDREAIETKLPAAVGLETARAVAGHLHGAVPGAAALEGHAPAAIGEDALHVLEAVGELHRLERAGLAPRLGADRDVQLVASASR